MMMQTIEIQGTETVLRPGKLLCIGRNYALHAAEMKADLPTEPMVFLKPASALTGTGGSIIIPNRSREVHHEIELVVVIGEKLKHAHRESAMRAIAGYAVGLDMTARDLQAQAKKTGSPWSVAKGFDTFAPLGEAVSAGAVPNPQALELTLSINGDVRQRGSTSNMIFDVAELLVYCSSIFTLEPGDLLFTGTPEGVGPVHVGDRLRAEIAGLPVLEVDVRQE